ncbi:MAG: response regulator [Pseudomonadales bacterium]
MLEFDRSELSVLLIEPSAMQQGIIKRKLEQEAVTNVEVASGKGQALGIISKYPPDLIISNLYYEDGTALELLQLLRKHKHFDGVPFVLISSEQRRDQLEIFKQSGILAMLSKPFSQEQLGKAINATLSFINQSELYLENYDVNTLRVVVVDDSRLARKAVVRALNNLGMNNLTEFDDGCHAIEHLKEQEVDLVVTDYNMPQVNGVELAEYVRSSAEHSHVPVLMVTSEANDSHLAKVQEAGVTAILDKPFDATKIKSIIVKMFQD